MSHIRKYLDLKYEDKKQTLNDVLDTEKLPIVARTCHFGRRLEHSEIPQDIEIFFQETSEETFAHIKVLKFYDNDKKETEQGAEYVLEHETFVGNEYLMPLKFGRLVKYVRRPESPGRYLTIKQVVSDCPTFVRAENEITAHLSSDANRTAVIPAKAVLELRRKYKPEAQDICRLDCSDGNKTYTFSEYEKVNFSQVEKNKLYSLQELSRTTFLPKVILFQDVSPEDVVLKDNELRSALVTIFDGPIEVLGFVKVEYLTCWIRNKTLKTYETMLIPKDMWNKMYIQERYFHTVEDKESHILQKYGPCLKSNFVHSSLYVFQLNLSSSVWLRSPDFFKQKLDGNAFYEILKVPFTYSSDEDDDVYAEIEDPRPPVPKRDRNGASNASKSVNDTELKAPQTKKRDGKVENRNENSPNKLKSTNSGTETRPISSEKTSQQIDRNEAILQEQHKPHALSKGVQNVSTTNRDQKYALLEFAKAERVYDMLDIHGDSAPKLVPLGYSDNPVEKTEQYIELGQVRKVLDDKQTKEDFFSYSVKEVSFCFEHCGLKSLADVCYEKKLDGSFFKGFRDWKELNLSTLDVIILKKVIYEGWRSKDDSTYNIGTRM